ncbi:FUSC family protein [Antribacter gilvus]|uniref:FUSC family protein n=1 Tax=Antribacter gilvus TaxID=2304675 RepID=UPI000F784C3A|nr:hypothetical protein [Antribacter gilvus]
MDERLNGVLDQARRSRAGRVAQGAHRLWVLHPSWSMAVKGAVAAALAWFLGLVAPAPFSEYPYYAPLGAVVVTTGTLVRSARAGLQAAGAILIGAAIARGVDLVLEPGGAAIALAVGLALLCAGWSVLGDMGTWAVTSALFVLIIGASDPADFVGAYAGLVVAGALIGIGVNLVFPPLPLTPSEMALDRLRDVLVEQLDLLADGLDREVPPSQEEWGERRRSIEPTRARARESVQQAREAVRANRRARRYREWATSQVRRAGSLGTSADVVDEITRLVADWETRDREDVALGPPLRPVAADAFRAFAQVLRTLDREGPDADSCGALDAATEKLRRGVHVVRADSEQDYFVAGALVLALRRAAAALASV